MKSRMLISLFLGAVLYGISPVHAASVSFSDTAVTANVGDTITIDILMDFTGDPTLGGGTDIFYDDSVLSFQSFSFGTTTLTLDGAFSRLPDDLPNKLEGMAFGNFGGLSGPGTVGTLTFQAIAVGDITLTMADTSNALAGGAFTSAISYGPQSVSFGSSEVSITNVPVPAAVWLLVSGLLGLTGVARKRKTV